MGLLVCLGGAGGAAPPASGCRCAASGVVCGVCPCPPPGRVSCPCLADTPVSAGHPHRPFIRLSVPSAPPVVLLTLCTIRIYSYSHTSWHRHWTLFCLDVDIQKENVKDLRLALSRPTHVPKGHPPPNWWCALALPWGLQKCVSGRMFRTGVGETTMRRVAGGRCRSGSLGRGHEALRWGQMSKILFV